MVGLQGTRYKQMKKREKVIQMNVAGMCVHRWGYAYMKEHTNRACGVDIAIPDKWSKAVRQTWSPADSLQGRGGAIRVRCENMDLAVINLYFAVGAKDGNAAEQTNEKLTEWANDVLVNYFAEPFHL